MKGTYFVISLLLTFSILACQRKNSSNTSELFEGQKIDFNNTLTTIAVGSCNRQNKPQEMWPFIQQQNPDLWVWLGDNIYGDSEDMSVMLEKYQLQKSGTAYTSFRKNIPVIGIWDDHDYGTNDGDKTYPKKKETQQLMLDFLDVPKNAAVRKREGAYQSYTFGEKDKKVKIILLDGRYFRDELAPDRSKKSRYLPNVEGDLLGEAQWKWLESELKNSEAQIHLIACGIQFIPEEQIYEKWANFPTARKRFFDLLDEIQPANPILLSGDRHISEVSQINLQNLPVYELTASGMTHTWSSGLGSYEPNKYRKGDLVVALNYALLEIDWSGTQPKVVGKVFGLENKLLLEQPLN